jgi:5-methylcytosine-specific restriction protein A
MFIKHPDNIFCKLQLNGCTNLAECTDHIVPPTGPSDPLFWDKSNHQAACIHCNSVKGHTSIKGDVKPFGG